jgi:site-specific recombinase XerD
LLDLIAWRNLPPGQFPVHEHPNTILGNSTLIVKILVPTRNVRLAAIHSFFEHLAIVDPRHLAHCKSILAVPFERRAHRIPGYLERSEIRSLFAQIDCQTLLGEGDDTLLRLPLEHGMRVQELVDLDVNHLAVQPSLLRTLWRRVCE